MTFETTSVATSRPVSLRKAATWQSLPFRSASELGFGGIAEFRRKPLHDAFRSRPLPYRPPRLGGDLCDQGRCSRPRSQMGAAPLPTAGPVGPRQDLACHLDDPLAQFDGERSLPPQHRVPSRVD